MWIMARRKNELIFQAAIDYSDSRNMKLDRSENSEVEQQVRRALTEDLPHDMDTIFGITVDVQIKGTRDGSIVVFFGAVVAGISALSRYKNLYDSVVLIQNQACRVIQAALNGAGRYNVNVRAVDPNPESLEDRFRWWRKHAPFPMDFMPHSIGEAGSGRANRDGFFWFLLALCILEGIGLGLLVYRAVMKTYF
jgi:hypothetical protein